MNDTTSEDSAETASELLIKEAPLFCKSCGKPLCLRKQVLNLALGYTSEMHCLVCLSKMNETTEIDLLNTTKPYILSRKCFQKEWVKYLNVDFCPDKQGCYPETCFQ
jgi:hypothetical protein